MSKHYIRVGLEAPEFKTLGDIQKRIGAESSGDVIRRALAVFNLITESPYEEVQVKVGRRRPSIIRY